MKTSFTFYSDPSHGWLKVSIADIKAVDLQLENFSGYSYREGLSLYLEEDQDAPTFLNAYKAKNDGNLPIFKDSYTDRNSHIRRMERI
jgi:hypothetical protein